MGGGWSKKRRITWSICSGVGWLCHGAYIYIYDDDASNLITFTASSASYITCVIMWTRLGNAARINHTWITGNYSPWNDLLLFLQFFYSYEFYYLPKLYFLLCFCLFEIFGNPLPSCSVSVAPRFNHFNLFLLTNSCSFIPTKSYLYLQQSSYFKMLRILYYEMRLVMNR